MCEPQYSENALFSEQIFCDRDFDACVSLRLLGLHFCKENDFIPTDSFSDAGNLLYDKKGKDALMQYTGRQKTSINRLSGQKQEGSWGREGDAK